MMRYFEVFDREDLRSLTNQRKFETRLGETIQTVAYPEDLESSLSETKARYVVFGIPEQIGDFAFDAIGKYPVDEVGRGWDGFLGELCNMQSNDFFEGSQMLLLGQFDFGSLALAIEKAAPKNEDEKASAYRHAVGLMDDAIEQLVHLITQNNKLPIVIGGGQNNAYALIMGAAKGWAKNGTIPLHQINAINLDHAPDFGPMEGRHSRNPFTYAEEDGYLEKYFVLAPLESNIPQNLWMEFVNNPFLDCVTYEDIFIQEKQTFESAVATATEFTIDTLSGIEVDLGCIYETTCGRPTGISPLQARTFMNIVAQDSQPAYLHISGTDGDCGTTLHYGKLAAYMALDFMKALEIALHGDDGI